METPRPSGQSPRQKLAGLLERGADASFESARDSIRAAQLLSASSHRMLEGNFAPALMSLVQMNKDIASSLLRCVRGDGRLRDAASDAWGRLRAGLRYERLVASYGQELFGSARFPGERVLVEDEFLRLSYIPPAEGVPAAPLTVFHAGGGIPYSDRIFRLLPETNFFDRFRERGIGLYAMELRGDRHALDYSGLTLEKLIDSIERMSTVAFEHNDRNKMVLEGYCGHGMQAIAYAAAKPADAEAKFLALATFVAPIDGTECKELGELTMLLPQAWVDASQVLWRLLGGYVPGDTMRSGLDLSLKTMFHKTPFGYFMAGWSQKDLAKIDSLAALSPSQRRDLAGAYWISPDNANRFPIPVGLARYATSLFRRGIAKDGTIGFEYQGKPLSLRAIVDGTKLPVVGFYGGRDVMVPDRTAFVLMSLFGERYRHVVHPLAGHISYVLSPRMWNPADARGLKPNPIDVLLSLARQARFGRRARGAAKA